MKGDPGRPENWYQLARRDLDKACRDLAQGDLPYAAIGFQQAAEKACKGWLIAHGWRLVKTHDQAALGLTECFPEDIVPLVPHHTEQRVNVQAGFLGLLSGWGVGIERARPGQPVFSVRGL